MFRGRFEHSIDEKGRIAIPSRFRNDLVVNGEELSLIITNFDKCLCVYPIHVWEQLEEKLAGLPQFDPKIVAFQRYFVSGAAECTLDKAGRILIPANLRAHAGIAKDCIIAGQIRKFEIWSTENWDAEFKAIAREFTFITETMSTFGINL